MYFNLKKSKIYLAVKSSNNPFLKYSNLIERIGFLFSIVSLLAYFYFSFIEEATIISQKFLGGFFLSLSIGFAFFLTNKFWENYIKKPKIKTSLKEILKEPHEYNVAEVLDYKVAQAIYKAGLLCRRRKIPKLNSSALFYFLLPTNEATFIFQRATLRIKDFKEVLKSYFKSIEKQKYSGEVSEDFEETIMKALEFAEERDNKKIKIGDILTALTHTNEIFKEVIKNTEVKKEDIDYLAKWYQKIDERNERRKKFWKWENLSRRKPMGDNWTAGFTITLDQYSIELSDAVKRRNYPEIIGHEKEIEIVERVLARGEINNALLVGRPGTGRKSIVFALARKTILGKTMSGIANNRIVELKLTSLLAKIENPEKVEKVLDKIFQEVVEAGNVILVIDNIHDFVGNKNKPGTIDISGLIASYLHFPQFQIIGIASYDGLHQNLERNSSLLSLFEKIEVSETTKEHTMVLLEKQVVKLEAKHDLFITFPAIRKLVEDCEQYIPNQPFPKKAEDLLDEIAVYVAQSKDKIVLPEHVSKVLSEKTELPLGGVKEKEKEILLNLEDLIHERIINQDYAVSHVAKALRRARAEIEVREKPIGTFLFLGPTGVGKTETAKALTEIYFGNSKKMIRLDMSEFQNINDIDRLIGTDNRDGFLTTQVREEPFSLILLDELEKAHPKILNLFLQVLDEGFLTDGMGRRVDFRNCMVIATSNAGYKIILENLDQENKWDTVKEKLIDNLFEKGTFRPEFINRFDSVIVFGPLSKENLLDISELMLDDLREGLDNKGIEFEITEELKEKIVDLSYEPRFGAREMGRVIQDKVKNSIANALLSDKIERGDKFKINPEDFEVIKLN